MCFDKNIQLDFKNLIEKALKITTPFEVKL